MKRTMLTLLSIFLIVTDLNSMCNLGALQEVAGSPFAAENGPNAVAFSPIASGNLFSAVVNSNNNNISVYAVDQTTGSFTPIVGSPFATGIAPNDITFSPIISGNLFAATVNNSSDDISVYTVNQTTGFFTPVVGSPFPAGNTPAMLAFSPPISGTLFAAVVNSADSTISVYSVNPTTGVFTEVAGSPFGTGITPLAIAFSPIISGNLFVATADFFASTVSVFSVNQTTGALTPVTGSPFATGNGPSGVAFSPIFNGNLYAATANFNSNDISVYSVNSATGAFTPVAGSPFATAANPVDVAFSSVIDNNLFALVSNGSNSSVSTYSVDSTTGLFTPVVGSPFTSGSFPTGVAFSEIMMNNLWGCPR